MVIAGPALEAGAEAAVAAGAAAVSLSCLRSDRLRDSSAMRAVFCLACLSVANCSAAAPAVTLPLDRVSLSGLAAAGLLGMILIQGAAR